MTKAAICRIGFLGILSLFLCLGGPGLFSQGDAVIVPGTGVGVLRLGEPLDFIRNDLPGKEPSHWRKVDLGTTQEMWLYYKDIGLTFVFDFATKTLERIIVTTPNLLVSNTGIHVGSQRDEVLRYFTEPLEIGLAELNYPRDGIKFVFGRSRRVVAIEVKRAIGR